MTCLSTRPENCVDLLKTARAISRWNTKGIDMKTLLLTAALLMAAPALAQTFPTQPEPPGPVKIPDAPQLPYHFGARPVAPNGKKFGNVAAITILPNGDLLVFNRNPAITNTSYLPGPNEVACWLHFKNKNIRSAI